MATQTTQADKRKRRLTDAERRSIGRVQRAEDLAHATILRALTRVLAVLEREKTEATIRSSRKVKR